MHTLNKYALFFACALSALAGCVDTIGFIHLGGFFISFMSGNSTRFAFSLQSGDWQAILLLGAIIVCFVAGAALGSIIRHRANTRKAAAVMTVITFLLLIAAFCVRLDIANVGLLLIVISMGAANSVLQGNSENVVGVTYMTGTLVKLGQRIAVGERNSWVPYLMLWAGLIMGGITGAALYAYFALEALWFAAVWAGFLTLLQWRQST